MTSSGQTLRFFAITDSPDSILSESCYESATLSQIDSPIGSGILTADHALIEDVNSIAKNKGLIVVIPKKRLKKLIDVLTKSTYVGKPLYFENKIRVLFYEDVEQLFEKCKDNYAKIKDLEKSLRTIDNLLGK